MQYGRFGVWARVLPFLLAPSGLAYAQSVQAPTRAEAEAAAHPAPHSFTRAQLDQMLAPIALYPDQLLTELLMAATFPQQVIDAATWLRDANNAALSGDQLVVALQPLPWDPSVKSLVAFPQVITLLNSHLDWTEGLGIAFADQQVEMMARVQLLRERAVNAGRLKSTRQLVVQHRDRDIIIEPADPAMVYVPVYNPAEVYGAWPDRGAPPVYLPPPPGLTAAAIGAGLVFGAGVGVVAPLWGWGHPDWRRHEVVVDPARFGRITDPAQNPRNNITVEQGTWHRTAPVVPLSEAERARPTAAVAAPHPPGTVAPSAIVLPRAARAQSVPATAAAPPAGPPVAPAGAAAHPAGETPHPAEVTHAPGAPSAAPGNLPRPAEAEHAPPTATPHPAEAHAPPAAAPHPAEANVPPGAAPHPAEAHEPPAAAPHTAEAHAPPAAPAHPAEAHAPPAAPAHPAEAHAPPAAAPHPAEAHAPPPAPPHPAEAHAPSAAPPHPAEAHAPPAAPPHPVEVHAPPAPHPPAPPAQVPSAATAKKPPAKPGEGDKEKEPPH